MKVSLFTNADGNDPHGIDIADSSLVKIYLLLRFANFEETIESLIGRLRTLKVAFDGNDDEVLRKFLKDILQNEYFDHYKRTYGSKADTMLWSNIFRAVPDLLHMELRIGEGLFKQLIEMRGINCCNCAKSCF